MGGRSVYLEMQSRRELDCPISLILQIVSARNQEVRALERGAIFVLLPFSGFYSARRGEFLAAIRAF
jgi:hypothetical protein